MSDAVGMERISKIVGYKIQKGDFKTASLHLPQRIAILAEANTDLSKIFNKAIDQLRNDNRSLN